MTDVIDRGTAPARASRAATWAGWIVGLLPAFLLLFSASMKLTRNPTAVKGFHDFGYADHHLLILGVVEALCTLIYLVPQTSVLGAILLTGYLGGATATHVRLDDPSFVMPVLCGVLVWLGLFLRDRRLRALVPFRSAQ